MDRHQDWIFACLNARVSEHCFSPSARLRKSGPGVIFEWHAMSHGLRSAGGVNDQDEEMAAARVQWGDPF